MLYAHIRLVWSYSHIYSGFSHISVPKTHINSCDSHISAPKTHITPSYPHIPTPYTHANPSYPHIPAPYTHANPSYPHIPTRLHLKSRLLCYTVTVFILFPASTRAWLITSDFSCFANRHFLRFCITFFFRVYRLTFRYFLTL